MVKKGMLLELLDELRKLQEKGSEFTAKEVAESVGYSVSSINKYFNEKLKGEYIVKVSRSLWKCNGINKLSNDEFFRLMSQSLNTQSKSPDEIFSEQLMKRSHDAFTLALEVYNRPTLGNRVEAFTIMMVNAWELMLKSELANREGASSIFKEGDFSISIREAMCKLMESSDNVAKNLETLIDLRDHAIHLLIPELQPQLSRLFQATVLNYQKRYKAIMGNSPLAGQSVGLLSLIVDGCEPEVAVIKETYGELTATQVKSFLGKFTEMARKCDSDEFSISVDYKLALTKKSSESDLSLSLSDGGEKAIIIRETKDPDITHPYHQNTAIAEINLRQKLVKITSYSFQAVVKKNKTQKAKRSNYHYELDGRHRYSEAFIEWFVNNLNQKNWLDGALKSHRNRRKKA
ncbi:DUF3644 domain-containing protein [Vibrio fluvialis]|uniref:DUF3644 domain-containing protein n=1 Tax=Vibrio fluvialis TaxID=676 RepID=UPI00192AC72B|nr:DUF3644 domain-containing protein [Vibrio fluvialis]ELV8683723.1 DUF3644 domain-containing protein [Vibrio fluvialis]EME3970031.1 DUF3644 domain-containing protein [Vibrio fluvialis]MBL4239967.1 DUF3644 domain-containing protein [Vibrio fluvialis]MBL4267170.1 DUF3644 domain-containing protein [Vibrio fluvialis]MBL4271531.1 DUF3644 domain-containing protein [Vibrio fluvialis]